MTNPVRERAIEELRRMVLGALGGYGAAMWLFGSRTALAPAGRVIFA